MFKSILFFPLLVSFIHLKKIVYVRYLDIIEIMV